MIYCIMRSTHVVIHGIKCEISSKMTKQPLAFNLDMNMDFAIHKLGTFLPNLMVYSEIHVLSTPRAKVEKVMGHCALG